MSDERFIDIETRLAHQDHALAELDRVVIRQQADIDRLERLVQALVERLASLADAAGDGRPRDERPPHY